MFVYIHIDESDRNSMLAECASRLKTLKGLQSNYSKEVAISASEMPSSQAKSLKKKAKGWKNELNSLEGDIGRAQVGIRLYGNAPAANLSDGSDMSTGELKAATTQVQHKTMNSLNNTKRMVEDSERVAADTLVSMQIQGEQIDEMISHTEKINRDLTTNFGKKNQDRAKGKSGNKPSRYARLMGRGKTTENTEGGEPGQQVSLAVVGLQEADETATDEEFLAVTASNSNAIDDDIDQISAGLSRLGEFAHALNSEATEQNARLENLEVNVDDNLQNIEAAEKKIDRIRRGRNCLLQ
jgi:hypothetical protein